MFALAGPRRFAALALATLALPALSACPGDDGADTSTSTSLGGPTSGTDGPTSGSETTTDTADSADTTADTTADSADTTDTDTDNGAVCQHMCEVDGDCLVNGMNINLSCMDGLCLGDTSTTCTDDASCVPILSGWAFGQDCTPGGGECEASLQVCLEVLGAGHCATAPSEFLTCADINFDEVEVVDIDGNPATVCANTDGVCEPEGNFCHVPCQGDQDCLSEAYPVCDLGTGFCGCSSDSDCASLGAPQSSSCNDGVCGCGSDQDCVDGGRGDLCLEIGVCGCSGDDACVGVPNTFDGGAIVCKDL